MTISRPMALVLGLLGLQSALFMAFVAGSVGTGAFISLHISVCAAAGACGYLWAGAAASKDDYTGMVVMLVQLVAWTALAGPFGAVIAAVLLLPRRVAAERADAATVTAHDRAQMTRVEMLHGSILDSRLRFRGTHGIRPLLDVIMEGTQTEKFDALSIISKRYNPDMAPALRRALQDKDGSVRVLTATVMAQQHNAFTKRIGALQITAKSAPEIARYWRDLAQAHVAYAESGLLEASRVEAEIGQAQAYLSRAAELDPGNTETSKTLDAVRRFATVHSLAGTAEAASHGP